MTTSNSKHTPAHRKTTSVALPFAAVGSLVALIAALLLTWQVHSRSGDELFRCDTGDVCSLGSGGSWLLTGASVVGPFVALLGFAWTRHLHARQKLGPFNSRAIPDAEQIFEVFAVLGAGLAAYWLLGNGETIEAVDVENLGRPNSWLLDARDIRSDEPISTLVPTRRTWFLIGLVLSAPFAFSFGSMAGREWYGRKRRSAQDAAEAAGDEEIIDLTVLDLNEIEREQRIDDT